MRVMCACNDQVHATWPELPNFNASLNNSIKLHLHCIHLSLCTCVVHTPSPGVFSPGNPAAFQANYLAGQALLGELEALATSRAAVERLRASAAAAGWAKRWNLPVYFSLVYQDVAGEGDACCMHIKVPMCDVMLCHAMTSHVMLCHVMRRDAEHNCRKHELWA